MGSAGKCISLSGTETQISGELGPIGTFYCQIYTEAMVIAPHMRNIRNISVSEYRSFCHKNGSENDKCQKLCPCS